MKYLLDTNICIAIINSKSKNALAKLQECEVGEVAISSITVAELRYGADKSSSKARNHTALDGFLSPFEILDFDQLSAAEYGVIRAQLETKGKPIGPLGTLIAAQAVAHKLTLVTNNEREFKRVSKIASIENWLI